MKSIYEGAHNKYYIILYDNVQEENVENVENEMIMSPLCMKNKN